MTGPVWPLLLDLDGDVHDGFSVTIIILVDLDRNVNNGLSVTNIIGFRWRYS